MPVIRRSANAGTATPPEAGSHGAVMEVAAMSLSSHEQHALHSIEDRLCVSAPELASLLATFSRLTAGEDMPAREKTPTSRVAPRRSRRRSALRYRTRRLAGRPRRLLLWQAAGLVLGLLVAVGVVAGAMAITGLRPGW